MWCINDQRNSVRIYGEGDLEMIKRKPSMIYVAIYVNTLRPRQNRRHFADDNFQYIFVNENVLILIKISPKFGPKGPINNFPSLVEIMAWRRPGDKPFSQPMRVRLGTHICVIRPQWVKLRDILFHIHSACNFHPEAHITRHWQYVWYYSAVGQGK